MEVMYLFMFIVHILMAGLQDLEGVKGNAYT